MDFKFERDQNRFLSLGMDLNRPIDKLKPQKQNLLKNVRASHKFGMLKPRPGLAPLSITGSHSIRRLNDPANYRGVRITGHSTALYVNGTSVDTGYSGNPIALVPNRPPESPESWMYAADSHRMRKVNASSSVHQIGLPAPTAPPTVALAPNLTTAIYYKEIDNGNATTSWAATTEVSSVGASTARINTTVAGILYDTGTTGWCSVAPTSILNIGEGTDVRFDDAGADVEQVMVQSVHAGGTSTTISAIIFDSGTAGVCSLVLAVPYPRIGVDSMLTNTSDGTYGHVLSVYTGKDGKQGIRATTPAGSTWVAGDTIRAIASFRCSTVYTQIATHTIKGTGVKATLSATAGTGHITKDISGAPIDLTTIAAGIPANKDDYIHISFQISNPLLLTQGRIMFDVTNQLTPANAFKSDYYYKTFRPGDLSASAVAGAIVTELSAAQREELRNQIEQSNIYNSTVGSITPDLAYQATHSSPGAVEAWVQQQYGMAMTYDEILAYAAARPLDYSGTPEEYNYVTGGQLSLGSTWMELEFKISELTRVGTNVGADLSSVSYIRLEFMVEAGALTIDFHSLGIRGGHGPDSGRGIEGSPYIYRYRARCTSTGVVSNWSPASRNTLYARRQLNNVAAPSQYTSATEADVLEFQRLGGVIAGWHYVGQVANSASPVTFVDNVPDDIATVNSTEGQVNFQPWPIIGLPTSGTAATTVGTTVTIPVGGTAFNTAWAPGTRIEINDQVYTIYQIINTLRLELFESAGINTAVAWRVIEPIITSQSLYAFWGPLNGTMFACGDPINPQRLYFTDPNREGGKESNWIDITSPSEPLMNGVIYNGRAYVFSSERLFQLQMGQATWEAIEIPNGKGLWAKWCFTGFQGQPGPYICFLSKDGIYLTDGGPAQSMTEADMNPLFPNEGSATGSSFNEVLTPRMDSQVSNHLRMAYYDGHLYFDYWVVS